MIFFYKTLQISNLPEIEDFAFDKTRKSNSGMLLKLDLDIYVEVGFNRLGFKSLIARTCPIFFVCCLKDWSISNIFKYLLFGSRPLDRLKK